MAKPTALTLADLMKGYEKNETSIPPAIKAQIDAQAEASKLTVEQAGIAREKSKADEKFKKELGKNLSSKTGDGLNSNVLKMLNAIKENNKIQSKKSGKDGKDTLDKSREQKEFKSVGQRITGVKESLKDFFSVRGFLDKTGIVKRGSGGIFGNLLDSREQAKKAAEARIASGERARDPVTGRVMNAKESGKVFVKAEKEEQKLRRTQGDLERKIEQYKEAGLNETQISQTKEAKQLQKLPEQYAKVNPMKYASKTDEKGNPVFGDTEDKTEVFAGKAAAVTDASDASEEELETLQLQNEQTELLTKIEENTRKAEAAEPTKEEKKEESSGIMGLLSGIGSAIAGLASSLLGGAGSTVGKMAGAGSKYLSSVGGAGKLMKGVGIGAIGTLAGEGLQYGGEKLKEAGWEKTGKAVGTAGTAAKYAGYGAMIGSVVPGVGTAIGGAVGGLVGLGKGVYDNYFSGDEKEKTETTETESVSGTLQGVTGEQIRSHPNFKKYYDQAINEGADKNSAYEEATMLVQEDMVKEKSSPKGDKASAKPVAKAPMTNFGPTGTRALTKDEKAQMSDTAFETEFGPTYGAPKFERVTPKSANAISSKTAALNDAAKPQVQSKGPTVVTTQQINNQTQNAMFKTPVRNEDNSLTSYLKNRFA